jgi:Tfp pilus assembly protein PilN
MLSTNLATRPFYNVRAVQLVLAGLLLVVAAATLFNVIQSMRLTASQRTLGARADEAERDAAKLRVDAARIRAEINPTELQAVASRAREANAIIDRRAFSWTELFAQLEDTLPANVRITAVSPRLDGTSFIVSIAVEGRRAEDLDAFMEALEAKGRFHNVLATETRTDEEGLLEAVVEGVYLPPVRGADVQ